MEDPGQFFPGVRDGILVVRNGGGRLIGVLLALQVGHVAAPDVGGILRGAAVGGVIDRFGQLAVIIDALPCRVVHGFVTAGRGGIDTVVNLAVRGVAHIKAVGGLVLGGAAGVGPGAHRLGLQSRQGPLTAHLMRDHALDIVLQIHHVDDAQVPAGNPGILKSAPVAVSLEPGDGLLAPALRLYAQGQNPPVVVLKENVGGPGYRHGDGGIGYLFGIAAVNVSGGILRLAAGIIASGAHHVLAGDPGHPAVQIVGGVLRLLPVRKAVHLHPPGTQIPEGSGGHVPGITAALGHINISGSSHGNGGLVRLQQ